MENSAVFCTEPPLKASDLVRLRLKIKRMLLRRGRSARMECGGGKSCLTYRILGTLRSCFVPQSIQLLPSFSFLFASVSGPRCITALQCVLAA